MFTNADRVLAELAAKQDGVVTWDDMLSSGLSVDQATHRIPHYTLLYRGVFLMPGAPFTPRAKIRAACEAGAPNAAASHRSGAAMHGLPGGRRDLAEVTCPRWLRTTQSGLIVHESNHIDPQDVRDIDGIRVMRPERVLLELASIYRSPDFIEVVLHAMLRKKLATISSTTATFRRLARRGRPGVKVVRAVLVRWDPSLAVTESPPETSVLQLLRDAGLGRVVPQFVVRDATGTFVARADIGLPDLRVTVEYDSDEEHADEMSIALDNARRLDVIAAGWFPISVRKRDLRNRPDVVIAAIRAARRQPA